MSGLNTQQRPGSGRGLPVSGARRNEPGLLRRTGTAQAIAAAAFLVASWAAPASAQNFAWLKGSDTSFNAAGEYGAQGTGAPANTPSGRLYSASCTDTSGTLWLFGGQPYRNDLWKFNAATGHWTWMKGSNATNEAGIYGEQGTPDSANTPGARRGAQMLSDAAGNLWLFGGHAHSATAYLTHLWKSNVATGNWTWMEGSSGLNQAGVYGLQGTPHPDNTPGARVNAVSWTAAGNLWVFGGRTSNSTLANDLWKYDMATGNWTWMKGSSGSGQPGIYGAQGTPDSLNTPGAREFSVSWSDASGNLWLFGGDKNSGLLNDLWKYDTGSGDWTWMKGSNGTNQIGAYGTQDVADSANTPGARYAAIASSDASGNFWLFGGTGHSASGFGDLNDLWKFDGTAWTWMKGSDGINQSAVYGTQGHAAPVNRSGARYNGTGSRGPANTLYLFGGYGYNATSSGTLNDLWVVYLNASVDGAPVISSISFNTPSTLDVTFNEAMPGAALLPSNYTLTGPETGSLAAQPDSVTWISGNVYRLTWNSGASTGDHVTLTVPSGMTDVTGEAFGSGNSVTLPVALSGFELE